jgi:hypothetical protein
MIFYAAVVGSLTLAGVVSVALGARKVSRAWRVVYLALLGPAATVQFVLFSVAAWRIATDAFVPPLIITALIMATLASTSLVFLVVPWMHGKGY